MIISREDGKMELKDIPFGGVFEVEERIFIKLDVLSCDKVAIEGVDKILVSILKNGKLFVLSEKSLVTHVAATLELKC